MSIKTTTELLQERQRLLAKIENLGDALHGTLVKRFTTCNRPTCQCHQGKKHGPRFYLAINEDGKQRPKYLRTADLDRARQGVAHYHEIMDLLDELTSINLAILRTPDN